MSAAAAPRLLKLAEALHHEQGTTTHDRVPVSLSTVLGERMFLKIGKLRCTLSGIAE